MQVKVKGQVRILRAEQICKKKLDNNHSVLLYGVHRLILQQCREESNPSTTDPG